MSPTVHTRILALTTCLVAVDADANACAGSAFQLHPKARIHLKPVQRFKQLEILRDTGVVFAIWTVQVVI